MSELTRLLRESSRDCSGNEPSLSLLQIAAELGADILDSPTEAMLGAGRTEVVEQTGWTLTYSGLAKIWKAMLAAAPNPLDLLAPSDPEQIAQNANCHGERSET